MAFNFNKCITLSHVEKCFVHSPHESVWTFLNLVVNLSIEKSFTNFEDNFMKTCE